MNKQAQQGIQRCQKFHKQDTGELYMPTDDDIALPELGELKQTPNESGAAAAQPTQAVPATPTEEAKKPAQAKTQEVIDNLAKAAKTEEIKEPVAQEPATTPAAANDNTDFAELEEKLAAFKDKGNN